MNEDGEWETEANAISVSTAIIHGDSPPSNLIFTSIVMKVGFCCLSFAIIQKVTEIGIRNAIFSSFLRAAT